MICEENKCTGCGACSALCPQKCIDMLPDGNGFYFPHIYESRCIQCGLCEKNCPINTDCKNESKTEYSPKAFSFIHRDTSVLKKSSSGGAFMALAEAVILRGGVVFGAVYDENYAVVTASAEDLDGLSAMQGSKYVECFPDDSYQKVKAYLSAGRGVLYTGTPCRIAGLYAALGEKAPSNLITAEIICHGVPGNKLFQEYLAYTEKKYGKILSYTFRDKSKWGWGAWGSFTYAEKGQTKVRHFPAKSDYYYSLFYSDKCFRESCYNCKYANQERIADITMGDCWNVEQFMPTSQYKNGVSVVLVNSNKGEELFSIAVAPDEITELELDWARKNNQTLIRPTSRPIERDEFYDDLSKIGFIDTARKYVKIQHILPIASRYIPRSLKNVMRKMIKP